MRVHIMVAALRVWVWFLCRCFFSPVLLGNLLWNPPKHRILHDIENPKIETPIHGNSHVVYNLTWRFSK